MTDEDTMNPAETESPATETPESRRAGSTSSSANATTTTIACCARPRSSTTTASALNANAARTQNKRSPICCGNCLSVVDDFDRALTVDAEENPASYRKGVELIHAKLHDLLKKQGVRPINAIGEDFDPNLHQAVVHEDSPGHREGEVIEELRRGYTIGDRLLRPAMVKVAKA